MATTMKEIDRVYPRMYGESTCAVASRSYDRGLSPHVRGIRLSTTNHINSNGSIPACTGNPNIQAIAQLNLGVYPRMYGESSVQSEVCMT